MPDSNAAIIYSDFCRTITLGDNTVDLRIYKLEHNQKWMLEVVNEAGSATLWANMFDSDQDALDVFEMTLTEEGMETFLGRGDVQTIH